MEKAPVFFLPAATPENQESAYAQLAKWCYRLVPGPAVRIYSITYVRDGVEWTATVGEPLWGISRRVTRSQGKKIERATSVNDPAIVWAIFPDEPFAVVTNQRLGGRDVGSAWENPFFVGRPQSIRYFSVAE